MKRWLKQNLAVRVSKLCIELPDRMVTVSLWFTIILSTVKTVAATQQETDVTVQKSSALCLLGFISDKLEMTL